MNLPVQISNHFIEDLEKLARLKDNHSIENQEYIDDYQKGLNTKYNTVQQIEMDEEKRKRQKKKQLKR